MLVLFICKFDEGPTKNEGAIITETSPYSFGNFRKLSLCPFNLLIRFKCYNIV